MKRYLAYFDDKGYYQATLFSGVWTFTPSIQEASNYKTVKGCLERLFHPDGYSGVLVELDGVEINGEVKQTIKKYTKEETIQFYNIHLEVSKKKRIDNFEKTIKKHDNFVDRSHLASLKQTEIKEQNDKLVYGHFFSKIQQELKSEHYTNLRKQYLMDDSESLSVLDNGYKGYGNKLHSLYTTMSIVKRLLDDKNYFSIVGDVIKVKSSELEKIQVGLRGSKFEISSNEYDEALRKLKQRVI